METYLFLQLVIEILLRDENHSDILFSYGAVLKNMTIRCKTWELWDVHEVTHGNEDPGNVQWEHKERETQFWMPI